MVKDGCTILRVAGPRKVLRENREARAAAEKDGKKVEKEVAQLNK